MQAFVPVRPFTCAFTLRGVSYVAEVENGFEVTQNVSFGFVQVSIAQTNIFAT